MNQYLLNLLSLCLRQDSKSQVVILEFDFDFILLSSNQLFLVPMVSINNSDVPVHPVEIPDDAVIQKIVDGQYFVYFCKVLLFLI